jgi:hypothetical protein
MKLFGKFSTILRTFLIQPMSTDHLADPHLQVPPAENPFCESTTEPPTRIREFSKPVSDLMRRMDVSCGREVSLDKNRFEDLMEFCILSSPGFPRDIPTAQTPVRDEECWFGPRRNIFHG